MGEVAYQGITQCSTLSCSSPPKFRNFAFYHSTIPQGHHLSYSSQLRAFTSWLLLGFMMPFMLMGFLRRLYPLTSPLKWMFSVQSTLPMVIPSRVDHFHHLNPLL